MSKTKFKNIPRQTSFARSSLYAVLVLIGMAVILPPPSQLAPAPRIQPTEYAPTAPITQLHEAAPGLPNRQSLDPPALSMRLASIAPPVISAIPVTAVSKYPGLPDYPHPQYEYRTLAVPAGDLYPLEPFLSRISAPAGWNARTTSHLAPTIAVIDTGFALGHQNLVNRWALNSGETRGSTQDNDSDGYIGNWRGWDFVHNRPDPEAGVDNPTGGAVTHGTMTAGLAGLVDDQSKILPLQALDDNGSGYTDAVAAAVRYAADHGAKIISLSLGSNNDDSFLHEQIDYAISRGATVVAAAGNNGCDCLLYPAAYPEVIAVGASTASDARAGFSSYGNNLDVLAPGTAGDVCSSYYPGTPDPSQYNCGFSGTSFAAPIVAGLAALLLQQEPSATYRNITNAITLSADKIPSMLNAYKTLEAGYGRINIGRAISTISLLVQSPTQQTANQKIVNITSITNVNGTANITYCVSIPGALCDFKLVSKFGTIGIGQQLLDPVSGSTAFIWDSGGLGLMPGQWQSILTVTSGMSTISTQGDTITITP